MTINQGNNFLGLTSVDESDDTTISAPGNNQITITPPKKYIYVLSGINVTIPDPIGSTSGEHRFYVFPDSFDYTSTFFHVKSNSGNDISIQTDTGFDGDTENPSTLDSQLNAIAGGRTICSNSIPLKLLYINNTDADQTNTRTVILLFKIYKRLF